MTTAGLLTEQKHQEITVSVVGPVAVLTLNRPTSLNAWIQFMER
jgi:enoyl-CoA hydratase/carnithine racemase